MSNKPFVVLDGITYIDYSMVERTTADFPLVYLSNNGKVRVYKNGNIEIYDDVNRLRTKIGDLKND